MKKEQNTVRLYDLVESYEFIELTEKDKEFVLGMISEEDYNKMRLTIGDVRRLVVEPLMVEETFKKSRILGILKYPVEFYKIAVAAILIIALGFMASTIISPSANEFVAQADTVFVYKTDTITLLPKEFAENKIKRIGSAVMDFGHEPKVLPERSGRKIIPDAPYVQDLGPEDMTRLVNYSLKNNASYDSSLKEFVVSLN